MDKKTVLVVENSKLTARGIELRLKSGFRLVIAGSDAPIADDRVGLSDVKSALAATTEPIAAAIVDLALDPGAEDTATSLLRTHSAVLEFVEQQNGIGEPVLRRILVGLEVAQLLLDRDPGTHVFIYSNYVDDTSAMNLVWRVLCGNRAGDRHRVHLIPKDALDRLEEELSLACGSD